MNSDEKKILELVESGFLSIDDSGRIWRHEKWINYRRGYEHIDPPVRAELVNNNYLEMNIRLDGVRYRAKAHRIVWMYFNGDAPDGLVINHKNGIGKDNSLGNIEMVTGARNVQHAYETGLAHGRPGERHHNCKLTQEQVEQIRREYAAGRISQAKLGAKHGVGQAQIGRIIRYRRWQEGVTEKIVPRGLRSDNKSGYVGVRLNKNTGKWDAGIRISGKYYNLGGFLRIEDAAQARKDADEKIKLGKFPAN